MKEIKTASYLKSVEAIFEGQPIGPGAEEMENQFADEQLAIDKRRRGLGVDQRGPGKRNRKGVNKRVLQEGLKNDMGDSRWQRPSLYRFC